MTRHDYEKAAKIVRQDFTTNGDIFTKLMVENFVRLFRDDNPRFDEHRFRQACQPMEKK
jgi:hypothetical protein